jgi:hypothetical protein
LRRNDRAVERLSVAETGLIAYLSGKSAGAAIMTETVALLKLAAFDDEDLAVISAHVQDAVLKVGDMVYLPKKRRFAIAMNRFTWETAEGETRKNYERRRSALAFDRVQAARISRIDRGRPDAVLELLAISFEATDAPAGKITLHFAGGGAVQLDVEVIEVRLGDLGAAWATAAKPSHDAPTRYA